MSDLYIEARLQAIKDIASASCSDIKDADNIASFCDEIYSAIPNLDKIISQITCELSECFHWILKAALEEKNNCCLTIETCPELYAKALKGMGFEIEENRNDFHTLCGYYIKWN